MLAPGTPSPDTRSGVGKSLAPWGCGPRATFDGPNLGWSWLDPTFEMMSPGHTHDAYSSESLAGLWGQSLVTEGSIPGVTTFGHGTRPGCPRVAPAMACVMRVAQAGGRVTLPPLGVALLRVPVSSIPHCGAGWGPQGARSPRSAGWEDRCQNLRGNSSCARHCSNKGSERG